MISVHAPACTENQGFPYMSEVKETAATHNMAKLLLRRLGNLGEFHVYHLVIANQDYAPLQVRHIFPPNRYGAGDGESAGKIHSSSYDFGRVVIAPKIEEKDSYPAIQRATHNKVLYDETFDLALFLIYSDDQITGRNIRSVEFIQ